ncbi:MAG: Trm112 family protein [Desulfobulbus sp.]|nr:Trm112 family protein [Desulfobulbus sp.]
MIKKELLDILACPQCKGMVELNAEGNGIVCRNCKLVYEIRDNIPIMLIDEAKPIKEENDKEDRQG